MASLKSDFTDIPMCKYGEKCYSKRDDHYLAYAHPWKKGQTAASTGGASSGSKRKSSELGVLDNRSTKTSKHQSVMDPVAQVNLASVCQKFGFYMSYVHRGLDKSYNTGSALTLHNVLNGTKADLESICFFSYMIDVEWVLSQLKPESRSVPITIVVGKDSQLDDLRLECEEHKNIKIAAARLDIPYGVHHTKMVLLKYRTGIRIMITTANLVPNDWFLKSQSLWCSPLLPQGSPDSTTNFRRDLVEYLTSYRCKLLEGWIERIRTHDFSKIKVHLVASVPGRYTGESMNRFGHLKMHKLLSNRVDEDCKTWPVIGQFSSIGKLGSSPNDWLLPQLYKSLCSCKSNTSSPTPSQVKLIFPSRENVRMSLDGYQAGGSLPFTSASYRSQPYIKQYLHQWKANCRGRDLASPHIKSYTRISPDNQKMAWFLMTSCNMSKAAWGSYEKSQTQFMIRSYEIGVLFLPQEFGFTSFTVSDDFSGEDCFPLPFDINLTPYTSEDEPWQVDLNYTKPDSLGEVWTK